MTSAGAPQPSELTPATLQERVLLNEGRLQATMEAVADLRRQLEALQAVTTGYRWANSPPTVTRQGCDGPMARGVE